MLKAGKYTTRAVAEQLKKEAEAKERADKAREKAALKEKEEEEPKKKQRIMCMNLRGM